MRIQQLLAATASLFFATSVAQTTTSSSTVATASTTTTADASGASPSPLRFTMAPGDGATVTLGVPYALGYTAPNIATQPVNIQLLVGHPDLQFLANLTTNATGGTYNWTPSMCLDTTQDYALEITTDPDHTNYSGTFNFTLPAGNSSAPASCNSSTMAMTTTWGISRGTAVPSAGILTSASHGPYTNTSTSSSTLSKTTTSSSSVSLGQTTSTMSVTTSSSTSTSTSSSITAYTTEISYVYASPTTTYYTTTTVEPTSTDTIFIDSTVSFKEIQLVLFVKELMNCCRLLSRVPLILLSSLHPTWSQPRTSLLLLLLLRHDCVVRFWHSFAHREYCTL